MLWQGERCLSQVSEGTGYLLWGDLLFFQEQSSRSHEGLCVGPWAAEVIQAAWGGRGGGMLLNREGGRAQGNHGAEQPQSSTNSSPTKPGRGEKPEGGEAIQPMRGGRSEGHGPSVIM